MRNIWTIASREYKQYFISPVAYAFAFLFLILLGWFFFSDVVQAIVNSPYQNYVPNVQSVVGPMVTLFLFTLPAVTMGTIAQESRMGTLELMLTAPVRDWELIIGKWLGSFLFVLTVLAATLIFPIFLNMIVSPGIDQGLMVSGYIGLILMVGSLLAVGVAVSALFNNQLVVFLVNLAAVLFIWVFRYISSTGSTTGGLWSKVVTYFNFVDHFMDFFQGTIDLSNVIYYFSVAALALFLGTMFIESRRWR